MSSRLYRRAIVAAAVISASAATASVAGATTSGSSTSLVNGSFAQPMVSKGGYSITNQSNVPGWSTTEADGMIEIWNGEMGIVPPSGDQSAELNANAAGALYQDLALTPGTTYTWSVEHAGRCTGNDVAEVEIGSPTGSLGVVATMSDTKNSWTRYSGTFTVPNGQTVTRFERASVSSSCGNASEGNEVADVTLAPTSTSLPSGGATGLIVVTLLGGAGLGYLSIMSARRRRSHA